MVYKVYNVYEVNDYIKSEIGEKEGPLETCPLRLHREDLGMTGPELPLF
jgi:hypothetical protein